MRYIYDEFYMLFKLIIIDFDQLFYTQYNNIM